METSTMSIVRRCLRPGSAWLTALLPLMAIVCASMGVAHAAETITYYYTSPRGTVLAKADASGNILSNADYRPYGTQALGTPEQGPGYTGHVNDVDSGFVYMQARYYDPQVGRFLSADPVGSEEGGIYKFSRFAYANNNPITNSDPTGKDTEVQLRSYIIGHAPLQGDYGHQYVYIRDTDTGEAAISRAGPSAAYPGGSAAVVSRSPVKDPGGNGNVTLVTALTPVAQSADSKDGAQLGSLVAGSSMTLKEPIGAAEATLSKFNSSVDAAKIDYKPLSTNSNAYANTAYQVLTGSTPPSSSVLPGSDVSLKSQIPACSENSCGSK